MAPIQCFTRGFIWRGQLGLVVAFDKFDPMKGARFATCANWWIRERVSSQAIKETSLLKTGTTAFHKTLFFKYRKLKDEVLKENPHKSHAEVVRDIAQLCMDKKLTKYSTVEKIEEQIELFLTVNRRMSSLNMKVGKNNDVGPLEAIIPDTSMIPQDEGVIEDEEFSLRLNFLKSVEQKFTDIGKEREWKILKARKLDQPRPTLDDLASIYDVSRERIRQIEVRALERLKEMAQKHFAQAALPAQQLKPKALANTPNKRGESPLVNLYENFIRTGDITYTKIQQLKTKYFQLSRSSLRNKKRDWHIFEVSKFAEHPDKPPISSRLHGIDRSQVYAILATIDKTLLKADPLIIDSSPEVG